MTEKERIQTIFRPIAVLEALTPEAVAAVPEGYCIDEYIPIRQYPFRIGRESRVKMVDGALHRVERPKSGQHQPNNDLYLVDRGVLFNISREHAQIEQESHGYVLVDRGSAAGTKINDEPIGGNDTGGRMKISDGDEIRIGTKASPYRFRFIDLS